ncbi:hypothetical protein HOY80DRAFT_321268 [Tuber brumale]|nr:hypothetical protein HOY80DRAFT_321268 [Tuber brumale]
MPDPDTLFELEDARRKVATSNALLAYREACAETLVIEADEEQRKIRAQLLILEARYEKLYQEYSEDKDYFERVEPALRGAYASLRWHEDAVARYQAKNKELQEKYHRNLVGEKSQQGAEVAALQASLEGALGAKKMLQARILRLEDELLEAAAKKSTVDAELSKCKEDLEAYKKSTDALKMQSTEWEGKHRGSAAERQSLQQEVSTLQLDLQKQQTTAAENQSLQQEVISLRSELEKTQASLKKASESATVEREKDGKRKSQEVTDLKAALHKETKAREKAEKDLAKSKEDWEAKHEVLESKLESTRNKLVALKASSASAPAPPPPAATMTKTSTSSATASMAAKLPTQNPKKRASTLTMEDLELSTKRPRKTPPKTSEFSITPFLKRQTAAADTSVANATTISTMTTIAAAAAVTSEVDAPEAPEVGETTMIPAFIESKEPTKILLAGANRKRKAKNPTTEPDIPEATAAEEAGKPKPKPRKRKPVAAKTLFTEDDGSGRLTLAPLAESQELSAPRTTVAAAGGGKKGKKPGGGGLAGTLGGADLLVPSVSAFNNEFSPVKKRPEGLKKLFSGK